MDVEAAKAELPILREFIDFLNRQVGVYCDCLAGFEGNRVRIERQIPIAHRRSGTRVDNGETVIVYVSVEDPTRPDAVHHRIIRADHFIAANTQAGFNEQQMCRAIIVFIFAHWDEDIRPRLATVRGVNADEIQVNAFGDMRLLRHDIIHNSGILREKTHAKLKALSHIFKPGVISPSHDDMHKLFIAMKSAVAALILHHTGHLPGAPSAEEIVDIAIQNPPRGKGS
jgi:hypothetical protein